MEGCLELQRGQVRKNKKKENHIEERELWEVNKVYLVQVFENQREIMI